MDRSPINCPVVKQHFDRSYYKTHNFSGEESPHGQVAMDFLHGGHMGERTCVLHAHHMKDWSMFKTVVSLEEPDYLAAHPTVELLIGNEHYVARWFAGVLYMSSDPWPCKMRFGDDAEFAAWLDRVDAESTLPHVLEPSPRDRILVCSTCAFLKEPLDLFAAFAILGKPMGR